jgi:putative acetyltransferase
MSAVHEGACLCRPERLGDVEGIQTLLAEAFPGSGEAGLVAALRLSARPFVSIVAEEGGSLIGHVALSPVAFDPMPDHYHLALGLAPLAVAEAHRGQGIGAALVEAALEAGRDIGADVVVALGDPAYYGRFGFGPASALRLRCVYEAPADAFQAIALRDFTPGPGVTTVLFRPEFDVLIK